MLFRSVSLSLGQKDRQKSPEIGKNSVPAAAAPADGSGGVGGQAAPAERPGSGKQVLCKKSPAEVDESALNPLISLKYPVGD